MRGKLLSTLLSLAVALVVAVAPASAAIWHVSKEGTDGPGYGRAGGEDAFLSIQYAVDRASDGDEVVVGPGTYGENVSISRDRLQLRSAEGASRTVLDGGGGDWVLALAGSGLAFEGFTVQNAVRGLLFDAPQRDDVTVSSCFIERFTSYGIRFAGSLNGAETVIEKTVFRIGGPSSTGLSLSGRPLGDDIERGADTVLVIDDNDFLDLSGGLSLGRIVRGAVEITANDFIDCASFGLVVEEMGSAAEAVTVTVADNRFTSNGPGGGTALYLGNAERTTTIGRNRIQGNFAYGIRLQRLGYLGASRSRVDVKENVLSGCDRGLVIDSLYPLLPGDASFEGNNFYDNGIGFQVVAASAARFDASTFTVRNNNFRGNGDGAFINGSAVTVTARGNWWGHETGPFDPSGNPSGQGDAVSSGVDYASWLENAYAPGADDGGGGCDLGFSPLLVSLVIPLILLRRR